MSRQEYMKQLGELLKDIPETEKVEALAYYEDYFEAAGDGQEEEVIATLGSPEKVAAVIKDGLSSGSEERGEYTETGYQNDPFAQYRDVPEPQAFRRDSSADRTEEEPQPEPQREGRRNNSKTLAIIVLAVLAIPVLLSIVGGIFGGVFGIIGAIFGVVFGIAGGTAGAVIGGIVMIGMGIAYLFTAPASGIFILGAGMLSLAIGLLMLLVCIKFFGKFIPWLIRAVADLLSRIFRRGGERA